MDYRALGLRIRKARKLRDISQERLAEYVGISVTHMSHIETGHTKPSLAVFVKIAKALEVQADALLSGDEKKSDLSVMNEIAFLLQQCDAPQRAMIVDVVKSLKQTFDIHLP